MSYLLEMKSITKAFGAVKAVDNVSLRLNPGEVMSLCGENGSGKSTLMKVLCDLSARQLRGRNRLCRRGAPGHAHSRYRT